MKEMKEKTQATEPVLESLVEKAKEGDKDALEDLVRRIQDRIYGLAIRMLYHPADAEDATQEILIKIITHLDGFRGESSFATWVYRVASNHLITTHKRRAERWELTFDKYGQGIDEGLSEAGPEPFSGVEEALILKEVRLACMQGMLLCLKREIRLVFILGDIFEVTSTEGSQILDITPEAFRQRLSRGRKQIRGFMVKKCSLVNPANPCHCAQQVAHDIKIRLIDPENLLFANRPCHARQNGTAIKLLKEISELGRVAALFRSHPDYAAPGAFVEIVRKLVDSREFQLFK